MNKEKKMSTEKEFNYKIRKVLTELVLTNDLVKKDLNHNELESNSLIDVFVLLRQPAQSLTNRLESVTLDNDSKCVTDIVRIDDLRILLLVNFVAKLMHKRLFKIQIILPYF